jgi:pyridoxamine 5'-phosphate oxidase-like protein
MGPVAAAPPDVAIVLATLDPYGWPHPALVSYGEILALDAARLRLGLHAGSRSSRHLRESGRATLVFADAELCLYVKTEALALPAAPRAPDLVRFELIVRDVLEDRAEGEEAGARLSSGLAIAWPWDAQTTADQQARVRSALRE